MERACWSVGCTREFVSAVHQAGTDILAAADTSENEAKFWHAMKYVALYGSGAVCLVPLGISGLSCGDAYPCG
jgi:hypothetical protein